MVQLSNPEKQKETASYAGRKLQSLRNSSSVRSHLWNSLEAPSPSQPSPDVAFRTPLLGLPEAKNRSSQFHGLWEGLIIKD